MNYLKKHKEVFAFIVAVLVFAIAAVNVFKEQQQRANLIREGAIVISSSASCAMPVSYSYVPQKNKRKSDEDQLHTEDDTVTVNQPSNNQQIN